MWPRSVLAAAAAAPAPAMRPCSYPFWQVQCCRAALAQHLCSQHRGTHILYDTHCCAVHHWLLCCTACHKGNSAASKKPGLSVCKCGTTTVCQSRDTGWVSQGKSSCVPTVFHCCPATCDCCQGTIQHTACRTMDSTSRTQQQATAATRMSLPNTATVALGSDLSRYTQPHIPT
jgi:hypothetical protein